MNCERGGSVNMFILRKLLKVLLLPVAFVLFFTRWALETSVRLTEWAVVVVQDFCDSMLDKISML
jgi:hypothetical protein